MRRSVYATEEPLAPCINTNMIPTEIQSSIGTFDAQVIEVVGERAMAKHDRLAVEQPLDIRIGFGPGNNRDRKTISITMRTPGHDGELAVGLLFAEGVLTQPSDVLRIMQREPNVVRVDLSPGVRVDLAKLQRSGVTNSKPNLASPWKLWTWPESPNFAACAVFRSIPGRPVPASSSRTGY